MINLIFGSILFVLLIICFLKGIKAYQQEDIKKSNKIVLCITILVAFIDLAGFVLPGVNEVTNIDNSRHALISKRYNYIKTQENPVTVNGSDNIAPVINGDFNTINLSVGYGDNDGAQPAETPSPENTASAFETVDHFTVGWWDNSGGRKEYTIEEINNGAIDGQIIFNSISDSTIGHEFNFVGARENTGINNAKTNRWNGNVIEAEKGKTYLVRLFVHNNSRFGYDSIAEDVSIRFQVSDTVMVTGNDITLNGFDSSNGYYGAAVYGYITASNAYPSEYSDGVKFVSSRPFHLVYIPGTALYENGSIGAGPGYSLSDEVVKDGVLIGYDAMDGRIPGCYQYDSYSSIKVMPVFDD